METGKVARRVTTWVLVALLGAAWQTATAGEDLRGRLGGRPIGPYQPPGPTAPPTTPPTVQPPAITILNPGAAVIETTDASMMLTGSTSGGSGITAIFWRSSRGPSGLASGTASWATGLIPLELGANTITVIAYDQAGSTASDTITIHRESKAPKPVTLSWVAPTRRVDGTALTDLAGYELHYGRLPGIYDYHVRIDNPGLTRYVVGNLAPGNWYFSMTAFDSDGTESRHSNEVLKRVQ